MSYLKKIRSQLKADSAFTLIELLVVIAIIGILSSVVLASLNGARESARDARRQSDLGQIRTSLALMADECGDFPTGSTVTASSSPEGCDASLGEFMSQVPVDPSSGDAYGYADASGTAGAGAYCLAANLEGGSTPDNNATACEGLFTADTYNYFITN